MPGPDEGGDAIHIAELELKVQIGVLDEERARAQRLTVSITLWPSTGFEVMKDRIEEAIDYAAVVRAVEKIAGERADKLIETLAEGIAAHLLATYPIARVQVELRKFILPDVKHVAVFLTRERAANA